jgi:hypothetical protein
MATTAESAESSQLGGAAKTECSDMGLVDATQKTSPLNAAAAA